MSFAVGNIVSCFVPGTLRRRRVRMWFVKFGYRGRIKRLVRYTYGERTISIKPVQQRTLRRAVFLVNDKFFIKIFRDVPNSQIKRFIERYNRIRAKIDLVTPTFTPDRKYSMYISRRVPGMRIDEFNRRTIENHREKINNQVKKIITDLQSIPFKNMPNGPDYLESTAPYPAAAYQKETMVITHGDISETNILFDAEMNVTSIIDWDTLTVSADKGLDFKHFTRSFDRYIQKHARD